MPPRHHVSTFRPPRALSLRQVDVPLAAGSGGSLGSEREVESVNVEEFYEPAVRSRVTKTFLELAQHDISRWALTGGTAIELHLRGRNTPTFLRPLHDLDFFTSDFACLPETLGQSLLLRHVHPDDPPAKCLLQGVFPQTVVRIDVFRAYGSEMDRASTIELYGTPLRLVALEDLVARHARLCCDILRSQPLAPKFARDFLRIVDLVQPTEIESIWQEHRKPDDPPSFANASRLLRDAIATRSDLLVPPVYSADPDQFCPRCQSTPSFKLASAKQVFELLGYC
jgi:hypothetical protein